jgi:hypothetical protein
MKLMAKDGILIEMTEESAFLCQTIKHMCENTEISDNEIIPVSMVDGHILKKVSEWTDFHSMTANMKNLSKKDVAKFNAEFLKMDTMLIHLIHAANYLNIMELLYLASNAMASMLDGNSPDQIRQKIGLERSTMTAEQQDKVRSENEWAFT